MRYIFRRFDVARIGRNPKLFGRNSDNLDAAISLVALYVERVESIVFIGAADNLIVFASAGDQVFDLLRVQPLHAGDGFALAVFPPDLDDAQLLKKRRLEPVVQQDKAGIVYVQDVVDIFRCLLGRLLVLGIARLKSNSILSRYERLENGRNGIVDDDGNSAVYNLRAPSLLIPERAAIIVIERKRLLVGNLSGVVADRLRLVGSQQRRQFVVRHSSAVRRNFLRFGFHVCHAYSL